jgi:FkbM family methyltransferase
MCPGIMKRLTEIADSARMYFSLFGAKGVIRRAMAGIFGSKNTSFGTFVPGTTRRIFLRLGTTDVAAFEHVFVNEEYGFSLAQPPSVIIDAGANVGMSAVYFSIRYPGATIIAIEPEPTNFELLKKNTELYPNIIPVNAALWNHDGIVQVHDSGGGHWGMRVASADTSSDSKITSVTLQTLLKQHEIGHIDLLKVDVEGAEYEIFEDAPLWIDHVDVICIELHDRIRPDCSTTFKAATADFPMKWRRGELHCVAREGLIRSQ